MKGRRMKRLIPTLATMAAMALLVGACTSSSEDTTTTTTLAPVTTTNPPLTTTTTVAETTTTSTLTQLTPPEYEIVSREVLDEGGEELVVELDPTSYQSLTDLDIYDIIAEVVGDNPDASIVHVVDSPDAAEVLANPESSDTDPAVLDDHYLARLEGAEITYLGPFESSGEATLGS